MDITSEMVKELRDKTGVGMMGAKEALIAFDGHMGKAEYYVRRKGCAVAEWKIVDGVRMHFTDEDLIEAIKKRNDL